MSRRTHQLPWRAAGRAAERQSVDGVLRETGWAFSHRATADLDAFVGSGERELTSFLTALDLPLDPSGTVIEIGAGIGRMTPAFTTRFAKVVACDLDAAFLERCRETVARYGVVQALQTVHVADGRTLVVPDGTAELTFSSFTLQHCATDEALDLTAEAIRVTRPGGWVALQYRAWTPPDVMLKPGGRVARAAFHLPGLGVRLARRRFTARLGWQVNRLNPPAVLDATGNRLGEVRLVRGPRRIPFDVPGAADAVLPDADARHWWLVGRVQPTG